MKEFKTESKKLLNMMVNSIYTHKEIFLRELISNASDAIDKLYFRSLTDTSIKEAQGEYEIRISADKDQRLLTIEDNGCGMTEEELENNLGTIAKSGSLEFKKNLDPEQSKDVDVIGQFGVGFYSAFMVADNIKVISKAYGEDKGHIWESSGAEGYSVNLCDKEKAGTSVILHIKEDTEDEKYSEYLEEYEIRQLIKKYSDYIRYPVKMMITRSKLKEGSESEYQDVVEDSTLNSITPLWKKKEADVKEEEYDKFYEDKFFDYQKPLSVIRQHAEGRVEYEAMLFIPGHAPFDYYSKEYEKGLQLYSSGVMIMDKCPDLLPDYFSFVKGVVDSPDLSLNISREMLQHDRQLKLIAKNLESKISSKLKEMMKDDREKYEKFFDAFGLQLKYGIYSNYGMNKEALQDLLIFKSSKNKQLSLKEYVDGMKEGQDKIFYAAGENEQQIALLPQVEAVLAKGYDVLYLTQDVDEFAVQVLGNYSEKNFANVTSEKLDISSDDEKAALKTKNDETKDLLGFIKETLGDKVDSVRFTNTLKDHPACISTGGSISASMEKTLNQIPGAEEKIKAQFVLEINMNHEIAQKLDALYDSDKDTLADYSKLLYDSARLTSGLSIEDTAEFSKLLAKLMVK